MKFPRESFSVAGPTAAFTLVEVMVVLLILVIFLGFGATSGESIKNQLAYFRDQQVVIAEIYKARALAVASMDRDQNICGYGIRRGGSSKQIEIFAVLGSGDPNVSCSEYYASNPLRIGSTYSTKTLERSSIQKAIRFAFISPIPTMKFESSSGGECFMLQIDSSTTGSIKINMFGQVMTASDCN